MYRPGLDCLGPLRTWRFTVCVVKKVRVTYPSPRARCGQGRAPLREAPSRAGRLSLRNFGGSNSLGVAYNACLHPEDALHLSDDGLAMFASQILVGRPARRARKLWHGIIGQWAKVLSECDACE